MSGVYLQTRFLHLSQAVEGFHRATAGGKYVSEDRFKPIADTLLNAIPSDVPDDLRSKLKSQIKFGNEPSLHKRLRALMNGLSNEERAVICENTGHFIAAIVDTRNDMTHLDEQVEDELILQDEHLHYAANKLELLMTILLLKHLGLPGDEVLARVRESGRFDLTPFVLPPRAFEQSEH
jgi:hypothetical protein